MTARKLDTHHPTRIAAHTYAMVEHGRWCDDGGPYGGRHYTAPYIRQRPHDFDPAATFERLSRLRQPARSAYLERLMEYWVRRTFYY